MISICRDVTSANRCHFLGTEHPKRAANACQSKNSRFVVVGKSETSQLLLRPRAHVVMPAKFFRRHRQEAKKVKQGALGVPPASCHQLHALRGNYTSFRSLHADMGSIVSYLFGSDSATDDENDAAEDVTTIRSLLLQVPESSEEQTPQQWDAILQRIEDHPEEAAVFCHGQESPRE